MLFTEFCDGKLARRLPSGEKGDKAGIPGGSGCCHVLLSWGLFPVETHPAAHRGLCPLLRVKRALPNQSSANPPPLRRQQKTPFPCTQPAETHLQETLNSRVTHTAQNQVGKRILRRQAPSLNRPICCSIGHPPPQTCPSLAHSSQVRYNVKSPSRSCASSSNQPRGCSVLLF